MKVIVSLCLMHGFIKVHTTRCHSRSLCLMPGFSKVYTTRCHSWSVERPHQRWPHCRISGQIWQLCSS